jgi:hypothetical protein
VGVSTTPPVPPVLVSVPLAVVPPVVLPVFVSVPSVADGSAVTVDAGTSVVAPPVSPVSPAPVSGMPEP